MSVFLRVVAALAKYGNTAVRWAWANRSTIERWIAQGMAIDWIINQIKRILGIR